MKRVTSFLLALILLFSCANGILAVPASAAAEETKAPITEETVAVEETVTEPATEETEAATESASVETEAATESASEKTEAATEPASEETEAATEPAPEETVAVTEPIPEETVTITEPIPEETVAATEPAPEETIADETIQDTMNASSDVTPAGNVELGEALPLEIHQDEPVLYTFTINTDGYYAITVPCTEATDDWGYVYYVMAEYDVRLMDGTYQRPTDYRNTDDCNVKIYKLNANTQYTIKLYNFSDYEILSSELLIRQAESPEKIVLEDTELTYMGQGNDNMGMRSLSIEAFVPNAAFCDLVWSSSDESVVKIENTGITSCNFSTPGFGTAVLTVTAPNGVSASCTVTVLEPKVLSEKPTELTLEATKSAEFTFTPEKSGYYTFVQTPLSDSATFEIVIYDDEGNSLETTGTWDYLTSHTFAELKAGKTYSVCYSHWNPYQDPVVRCALSVVKTVKPEKLILPEGEVVKYVNVDNTSVRLWFGVEFEPYDAYGVITYTSDNPDVVSVEDGTNMFTHKWGRANITVYLDGKAYATIPVTIQGFPAVEKLIIPDYSGNVGGYIYVYPDAEPEGAEPNVQLQIEDETIATLQGSRTIKLLKAGSTKVKAVDASGATTTFTVTVRQMEQITAGWQKKLTINGSTDTYRYTFVPEKSGKYAVITPDGIDAWIGEINNEIQHFYNGRTADICELEAGQEYIVYFENYSDRSITGTVALQKVAQPKTISLGKTKQTIYYDPIAADVLTLTAQFDDISKWSKLTWKSSNPSVLDVRSNQMGMYYISNVCSFDIKGTGTATITVTTENGLSASCKFTVKKATRTETLELVVPSYIPVGKEVVIDLKLSSSKAVAAPHVSYSGTADVYTFGYSSDCVTFVFSKEGTLKLKVMDQLTGLTATATLKVSNKPKAPVIDLEGVSSSGKNKITWKKVDGAEEYQVYRATSKDGKYTKLTTTSKTSYTDKSAEAGKKYYYKVRAVAEDGTKSSYSNIEYRYCDLPRPEVEESNVTSSGKIKLEWEKIEGAKEYEIYRATSKSGTYKKLATTEKTSYTDKTAKAGKVYYYKVKAIHKKSNANSAYSSVVGQTCKLERPDVSIKLSSGNPKLTWDEVDGAKEYKVYRATSKNGTYKLVKTTTSEKFTDKSVTAGKTYYYKVKAIHSKSSANSAYSSVDSIKAK